ncbi:MAG: sterol desaturase family protein [Gammaproteobacteria bacterium]|nr:sterol desaturase family protein [Gammaproteobacteria bacterium]
MNDIFMFLNLLPDVEWIDSFNDLSNLSLEIIYALVIFVFFALLLVTESCRPYYNWPLKQWAQSCSTNINLFLFNNVVMFVVCISSIMAFANNYADQGFLSTLDNDGWKFVIAFLCLDLITYIWHRCCHHFDWLWMFHKIHHSDPFLNVSTAFRLHIVELILFTAVKIVSLVLLGIDKTTAIICETLITVFIMFHHTNIAFRFESILEKLIISPALHRLHHSVERQEHDRNFGAVLSLWDRMFGTLLNANPVAIGIKLQSDNNLLDQLKFGFTRGTSAEYPANSCSNRQTWIETAAYYKAQDRNFAPGHEIQDWLEAEAEITKSL